MNEFGSLAIKTQPTSEPVTLDDAKAHLRVETTADDTYISSLITAARNTVESITRRALITQTWTYKLGSFPVYERVIELPLPPLQLVNSISYVDTDGNTQTFASSNNWEIDKARQPGRIALLPLASWPNVQGNRDKTVTIEFVAGFGNAAAVPEVLKAAIKLMIGHLYMSREPIITGTIVSTLPLGFEYLLAPWRDL